MWSYGLDLRSIWLTIVKVVVSSEGTYNCLFVEGFNYFLKCSNEIFDFFYKQFVISKFLLVGVP